MIRFLRLLPAILAFLLCAQAAEPQVFKCKDAAGRITYAGRECSDLALSSAGEVKDRSCDASARGSCDTSCCGAGRSGQGYGARKSE
jgi:hypothetical protein